MLIGGYECYRRYLYKHIHIIYYIYMYVLGRASASLTVRTEIGLGAIYKFVGAIYKKEISILTEKRQIQEGGCHTCGTVQRAAEQPAHGTMFFPSSLPWSICTLISHRQLLLMGQPKV
jgi:hypothetical protein